MFLKWIHVGMSLKDFVFVFQDRFQGNDSKCHVV